MTQCQPAFENLREPSEQENWSHPPIYGDKISDNRVLRQVRERGSDRQDEFVLARNFKSVKDLQRIFEIQPRIAHNRFR